MSVIQKLRKSQRAKVGRKLMAHAEISLENIKIAFRSTAGVY